VADGGKVEGLALEGRDGEVYRSVTVYRKSQERVAKEFGISQQRVSQILAEVRKQLPETDLDIMRSESLELYADLGRRALEIVDLTPAPLLAGKDGTPQTDPDTGKVIRDYGGRLKAMEMALKIDDQRRKLMGLDAATKAEVAGAVRFEIAGVDLDDLK
jgi:transcriptional regulator with XRE-family HTH domain